VYPVQNGKAENLAAALRHLWERRGHPAPTLAPACARRAQLHRDVRASPAAHRRRPPGKTASGRRHQVSKDVRVIADKDNNALVILASPTDYDKIESAIRKLDVVPRQVLIEVLIAEVTLTDDLQYGIDWFINARPACRGRKRAPRPNVTRGTLNPAAA
jgi:general secretion pathway protein D